MLSGYDILRIIIQALYLHTVVKNMTRLRNL